jgi:ribosomal protein S12 methylthiotransferase
MRKNFHPHRIGVVSLGCAKNLVDTEILLRQLDANQFQVIIDPIDFKSIDTAIINTCGFISDAKQESIDTILQFSRAKKSGLLKNVFVMGCLSQRYASQLAIEIPEVDGFFGVSDLEKIVASLGGNFRKELVGERKISTPSHYAYLKIAEGCDRVCSFCAIPLIRGKHVSRPLDDIIMEAKKLVNHGAKEIILISQDTTYYGLDLSKKRLIAPLLENLASIPGLEWIRLHYTYPHGFPMKLLDVMRDAPNICNYIDLPLQHASTRILKSMQRNMTLEKSRDLLLKIRSKLPEAALRTTFIVGYPGETEREFAELEQFVRESRFERMGVFTYSHEEGTAAYDLPDNIPEKIKMERAAWLMHIQEEISLQSNKNKIGKTLKVLIDSEEKDNYIARSEFDSPEIDNEILIKKSDNTLQIGAFYHVKIINAENFELYAELV